MKIPALLLPGAAVMLGIGSAVYADGVILNWPLVPGPSGYLGPFVPGTGRPAQQAPPPRRPMQAPVTIRSRTPDEPDTARRPGKPDETGRIGPTVRAERDADGKLLPTYSR